MTSKKKQFEKILNIESRPSLTIKELVARSKSLLSLINLDDPIFEKYLDWPSYYFHLSYMFIGNQSLFDDFPVIPLRASFQSETSYNEEDSDIKSYYESCIMNITSKCAFFDLILYNPITGKNVVYPLIVGKTLPDIKEGIWILLQKLREITKQEEEQQEEEKKEKRDRVFLPSEIKNDIFQDVAQFLKSKDLYNNELNLPWKRGICLYGPPGNGKTLLIRTISKYFGLTTRDILKCINPDGEIDIGHEVENGAGGDISLHEIYRRLYPSKEKPTLYYLEDIDRTTADTASGDAPVIRTHQLLKALDGVTQYDGILLFVTTNHMDSLGKALAARPGRIDRMIEIPKPGPEEITSMLDYHNVRVKDVENQPKLIKDLEGKSMAFTEELIKSSKMMHKKHKFTYEELKDIINRIHIHTQKFDKSSGGLGF